MAFYTVKVQEKIDDGKKIKKINNKYLVEADSVTLAEASFIENFGFGDFEVKSIKQEKYIEVYFKTDRLS